MRFTRYIWPTRRGWIIALSSVLWFLISLVNQTLFAFLLAATGAALTIVSLISALLSLRGIQLRRASAGDATVGHLLALPLEISNSRNRRRQDLVIQEIIPCAPEKTTVNIVPPLPRRGSILLDRQVLAVRRGEFRLRDVILRSGDPAGLFFRERRFALSGSVVVYPAILPVPDLFLHKYESAPTTTAQPISTAGTSQDFYGVREYNITDGMRYIHWRSSARYGRLMVKEFERNAIASAAIILDAQDHFVSDNLLSNLEYQVQAAASISNHCSGLYCSLAFAAGGSKMVLMGPQTAASANAAIRYSLATLKPGKVTLLPVLSALLPLLSRNTVVFCLSLSDNPPLRSALDALLAAGMDVRWCCADRASFAGKGKARLKARQHKTHPAPAGTFVRAVQATPDSKLEHVLNLTYMHQ
ncbi:MAG: DUF58 domain-containing protein [Oligosphaeraceae bacterium]|nr:DUF58 domain-containing protein [Oligosphaeraceae bacterium]